MNQFQLQQNLTISGSGLLANFSSDKLKKTMLALASVRQDKADKLSGRIQRKDKNHFDFSNQIYKQQTGFLLNDFIAPFTVPIFYA